MKYLNVIAACAAEPWALEKSKLLALANFLRFKAMGGTYSAEEVARITQKREREVQRSEGAVGVIPIQGVIGERMNLLDDISGGTSSELVLKQFRAMLNDNSIKAIVFDINSPGGVARSVEEVAAEIYDARGIKPIVAQVDTCAASAAYWIASQAEEVVVTPSGQVGSIGVYTMHEDISEMLANEGIKETLIYSGKYKVLGNNLEPLSDEARTIMQERVDALAATFVRSVARGRGVSLTTVNDQFGQGLMFDAEDSVTRGMADRVATMAETLDRFGVQLNPALSRARSQASAQATGQPSGEQADLLQRLQAWGRLVAAGETPAPSDFEDILRDAGVSKSQRARIASRMHAAVRSESGSVVEASNAIETVRDAIASLRSLAP